MQRTELKNPFCECFGQSLNAAPAQTWLWYGCCVQVAQCPVWERGRTLLSALQPERCCRNPQQWRLPVPTATPQAQATAAASWAPRRSRTRARPAACKVGPTPQCHRSAQRGTRKYRKEKIASSFTRSRSNRVNTVTDSLCTSFARRQNKVMSSPCAASLKAIQCTCQDIIRLLDIFIEMVLMSISFGVVNFGKICAACQPLNGIFVMPGTLSKRRHSSCFMARNYQSTFKAIIT